MCQGKYGSLTRVLTQGWQRRIWSTTWTSQKRKHFGFAVEIWGDQHIWGRSHGRGGRTWAMPMMEEVALEPTKPLTSTLKGANVRSSWRNHRFLDWTKEEVQETLQDKAERRFPARIYAADWRTVQGRFPGQEPVRSTLSPGKGSVSDQGHWIVWTLDPAAVSKWNMHVWGGLPSCRVFAPWLLSRWQWGFRGNGGNPWTTVFCMNKTTKLYESKHSPVKIKITLLCKPKPPKMQLYCMY